MGGWCTASRSTGRGPGAATAADVNLSLSSFATRIALAWADPSGSTPPVSFLDKLARAFSPYLLTETVLLLLVLFLAWKRPGWGGRWFSAIEAWTMRIAPTPARQILLVGLLAVLARAALLPWLGPPTPYVHDEQSLVLQAQTYVAGRLANPTPPLWEHFETFHVNMVPRYASMYFPGRGAPLALGLLLGQAWWGVWLSSVLLAMATVWMLQAWVPAPFALLGGLLTVLRFGVLSYWVNSYWGGAFTALGGALVIGALPRLLQGPSWRHGAALGLGVVILMTTRPFESLLLCVPVALAAVLGLVRAAPGLQRRRTARALAPAVVLAASGVAILLAYDFASTGKLTQTPYEINRATYATAPAFLTLPPIRSQLRGPPYFRAFYDFEATNYDRRTSLAQTAVGIAAKPFHSWRFYIGPLLTLPFLAGLWAMRRRPLVVGGLAFFYAVYAIETWNLPHYTAPVFPLVLIVLARGFMVVRGWTWRGQPTGLFLGRALVAALAATLVLPITALVRGTGTATWAVTNEVCCAMPGPDIRAEVVARIAGAGKGLVFVKDGPNNPLHYEMVYNEPDLARARVVWARELGDDSDRRLAAILGDRQVWEFEWRPDLPDRFSLRPAPELRDPGVAHAVP